MRRHFKAYEPVAAAGPHVDWGQDVSCELNVFDSQALINVFRVAGPLLDQRLQGLVVVYAAGQGFLKDRWIRGDAEQPVALHHLPQLAGDDQAAPDVIVPDALPKFLNCYERIFYGIPSSIRPRLTT